uniref:Uncharacterized protein n=1 Tax=Plectus sambesii TaxID=2011161 RepID=A0A914VIC8_9BILA
MLSAQAVLRQACGCWTVQVRSKSTKYLQNRPRSFKRRLYEAAVAPVLHERPQTPAEKCIMRPVYQDRLKADIDEMPPIEQALGRLVKNMMRSYRVM